MKEKDKTGVGWGSVVQWAGCLPSTHKALGSIPAWYKLGTMVPSVLGHHYGGSKRTKTALVGYMVNSSLSYLKDCFRT